MRACPRRVARCPQKWPLPGSALNFATQQRHVFLRRDLRQWADYYAHSSLEKASLGLPDVTRV